jgi:hypothetical protein
MFVGPLLLVIVSCMSTEQFSMLMHACMHVLDRVRKFVALCMLAVVGGAEDWLFLPVGRCS